MRTPEQAKRVAELRREADVMWKRPHASPVRVWCFRAREEVEYLNAHAIETREHPTKKGIAVVTLDDGSRVEVPIVTRTWIWVAWWRRLKAWVRRVRS